MIVLNLTADNTGVAGALNRKLHIGDIVFSTDVAYHDVDFSVFGYKKGQMADPSQNLILKSAHPSPLSVYRGFFGCKHFSQANAYLQSIGKEPIVW